MHQFNTISQLYDLVIESSRLKVTSVIREVYCEQYDCTPPRLFTIFLACAEGMSIYASSVPRLVSTEERFSTSHRYSYRPGLLFLVIVSLRKSLLLTNSAARGKYWHANIYPSTSGEAPSFFFSLFVKSS